jgi:hypothetical protein
MGVLTERVFSPRGFTDEDDDSLLAGNCMRSPMVLFGVLRQLSRVGWGWKFLRWQGDGAELQSIPMLSEGSGVLQLHRQQGMVMGLSGRLRGLFI